MAEQVYNSVHTGEQIDAAVAWLQAHAQDQICGGAVSGSTIETPDNPTYWFAPQGTYTCGSQTITIASGNLGIISYDGSQWSSISFYVGAAPLVNDLITGGTTSALTAEMGKRLKGMIDSKTIPVVNNLTEGGEESALSAEQGKVLKGLVDQCATATAENTNPLYPSMLAVVGEDITVLENKTGAWNGTTLTDLQGNYCVIIKMRAKVLSYINRKSGYGAVWIYSAEPNSSDYTQNMVTRKAVTATSGTLTDGNMMYVLMDIGTNINTFKCWFTSVEPTPNYVVIKIDDQPIKVNATYVEDENLFNYQNQVAGGDASISIFEFPVSAGCNFFVMWNDSNITPVNANDSWIEYDSEDNVLETKNFWGIIGANATLHFGKNNSRFGKVKLNTSTTKLRVRVNLGTGNTMDSLAGKVRMYINSDGHLTRFLYPLTLDGHPIKQDDLKGKVIACFGDSITSFGSSNASGGYPFFLQKTLDNGIVNYGRGNATFADWSDTDPTHNAPTEANNNHNNTISSQIRWMLAEGIVPDIAILNGGTNDIGKGNGYTWDIPTALASYPTTTAAVFQNVAMVICYAVSVLRNLNPNVKIYLSTPTHSLIANRESALDTFAANIKAAAEAFGLEVIDFRRYAMQPYPSAFADNPYYNDDTHPSQLGVDLMGRVVMGHLKNYVAP